MTFVRPLGPTPPQPDTALTKVARGIWDADPANPPFDSLIEGRFSWNLAHDQARAALEAIREPEDRMTLSWWSIRFQKAIDAILRGES